MKKMTAILIAMLLGVFMPLLGACGNNPNSPAGNMTGAGNISLEDAMNLALEHAQLADSQVTFVKSKLETDNGIYVYDIEFIYDGFEYEYDVRASDGEIIGFSKERWGLKNQPAGSAAENNNPVDSSGLPPDLVDEISDALGVNRDNIYITATTDFSIDDAKQIALQHAQLNEEQVFFIKAQFEIDDGVETFDIEFIYEGWEYEYEIHASTGVILDFDKERIG